MTNLLQDGRAMDKSAKIGGDVSGGPALANSMGVVSRRHDLPGRLGRLAFSAMPARSGWRY
ncbi:MAG TPA: hypothetical protein VNX15_11555 [Gemmatimonadales bacterium]|nr:hypothetical protein [Gemmatimonadales bacterium]